MRFGSDDDRSNLVSITQKSAAPVGKGEIQDAGLAAENEQPQAILTNP
ncbi:MAG: hypothetical protein ABH891_07285 [Candidatus Omnitrophota bacterium]